MDIATIITFISPFLPYLVRLGTQSAEKFTAKASDQFSETAWHKAQAVWNKLRPTMQSRAVAMEAVKDVAAHPDDEDMQAALRVQLKKLLQQNTELANEVAELLKNNDASETPKMKINQDVVGDRNQVIGSSQGTVITNTSKGEYL